MKLHNGMKEIHNFFSEEIEAWLFFFGNIVEKQSKLLKVLIKIKVCLIHVCMCLYGVYITKIEISV